MAARHRARAVGVQVLFQLELQPGDWRQPLSYQLGEQPLAAADATFLEGLMEQAGDHRDEIDQVIREGSTHWSLDQMGAVERAVLRLAVAELLFTATPPPVAISEAVELAKALAGQEAARFVNGVLGSIGRSRLGVGSGARTPGR
ncbi:MAG: transcription antitermination factor NusB [Candidatus Dormibacteria bacterium]